MNNNILLSIVIPTCGRPKLLRRAIDSALESCLDGYMCEVIIVPNGNDESWKETSKYYLNDSRVNFVYCSKPHGNAARNKGLELSQGKYIRFLDDDDFLYPEAAKKQLSIAIETNSDIVSGKIKIIDDYKEYGCCSFPETNDLISASILVSGIILPTSNIYLKSSIKNRWDERVNKAQDHVFLLDYVTDDFKRWTKIDDVVGCWYQHNMARVSDIKQIKTDRTSINYWPYLRTKELHRYLKNNSRLTQDIEDIIITSYWRFIFYNYEFDKETLISIAEELVFEGKVKNDLYDRSAITKILRPIFNDNPIIILKMKPIIKIIKRSNGKNKILKV